MTPDVDFGDIRAYPPDEYAGIIVLRMTQQDKTRILGGDQARASPPDHGGGDQLWH